MKKQKIFNFALTTMCVAVLSACGSSGGGSLAVENTPTTPSANANANTGADNSAALAAAQQEVAAAKAAAEKAEQAAKDAAEKAKEDTAKAVEQALKDKEAADKAAAEAKAAEEAAKKAEEDAAKAAAAASNQTNPFGAKDKLTAEPDTARPTSFVGFKQTVKVNSNLATNTSTKSDSTSDTPTPMAVQNPHPSLDTIVVAEPSDNAAAARVYLEDFDTRFAKTELTTGVGNRQLTNIYRTENGTTNGLAGNPTIEKQRTDKANAIEQAKNAIIKLKQSAANIDKRAFAGVAGVTAPAQDEIEKVNARIDVARNTGSTYGTNGLATGNFTDSHGLSRLEMDALYAKKNELSVKLEEIKEKVNVEEAKLAQMQFDLNTFNHNNPAPTAEQIAAAKAIHDPRVATTGLGYETKTGTHGKETGGIWVMSYANVWNRHQNFTEKTGKADANDKNEVQKAFVYKGRDYKGNIRVDGYDISGDAGKSTDTANPIRNSNAESVKARHLDNTVAELYGYRSRAWAEENDRFTYPQDVMDLRSEGDGFHFAASNLPLVNEYRGAKLNNVQYGRVTTKLDSLAATEDYLKAGLKDGDTPTYIASFGNYGADKTENHYFYRGINNVGAKELELLKADPKNGTIIYNGHAVAYGLNNNYRGDISIPTALGAQAGFVSGNHATLKVDLGNNQVTGSIYNKWYDSVNSPDKLRGVSLVDLQGVIADNGNIAGTATRTDNKATGVFGATLFGNGAEVGGSFASDKHTKEEQWGGVFAGIRDAVDVEAPPAPNMAVGVDKKN